MVVHRQDRRRRLTLVLLVITSLVLISLDERGSARVRHGPQRRPGRHRTAATGDRQRGRPGRRVLRRPGPRRRARSREPEAARREREAPGRDRAGGQAAVAENDRFREIFDIPQIEDYNGIVATGVERLGRQLPPHVARRQGELVGRRGRHAGRSSAATPAARSSDASCRSPRNSAVIQRIDDRDFGAGAQLVQGGAPGPTGDGAGHRRQQPAVVPAVRDGHARPSRSRRTTSSSPAAAPARSTRRGFPSDG